MPLEVLHQDRPSGPHRFLSPLAQVSQFHACDQLYPRLIHGRDQGHPFRPAADSPWVVHYTFRVFPYENEAHTLLTYPAVEY